MAPSGEPVEVDGSEGGAQPKASGGLLLIEVFIKKNIIKKILAKVICFFYLLR